jgi:hypothetical protein
VKKQPMMEDGMRTRMTVSKIALIGLLLITSCQSPTGPESNSNLKASYISGKVVDSTNTAVAGAIVLDYGGLALKDTTKSDGSFLLRFNISSAYSAKLIAQASGYLNSDTVVLTATPGDTTTAPALQLHAATSSHLQGKTHPGSIVLSTIDNTNISLHGTGKNESSLLTFLISDSLRNPVAGATVKFSVSPAVNGGGYVMPSTAVTDTYGKVSTLFSSGTVSGVFQITASTNNDSLKGSATVIVNTGLPAFMSLSLKPFNVAGLLYDNLSAGIVAILTDRNGNPVPNYPINFSSTGGTIQTSNYTQNIPFTDQNGTVTVNLISSNNRPPQLGIVTVVAQTVGDTSYLKSDSVISRTIPVVFSGATRIIFTTPSPLIVPDSGVISVGYRVQDQNGNPLIAGSEYIVSVTDPTTGAAFSGIALTGDADVKMADTQDTSKTRFTVNIVKTSRSSQGGAATITVTVKSDPSSYGNGNASNSISGYVNSTGSSGTGGGTTVFGAAPSMLAVNGSSARSIAVNESSNDPNASTALSFVVKDSLGNTITNYAGSGISRVKVGFSLVPAAGLSGGELLTPAIDSASDAGVVNTVFHAGTKSGIVRVAATLLGTNRTPAYVDITVSGGCPDSNRIALNLSQTNYPGLITSGALGTVSVQMSDQFNNPAKTSSIYFTTTGGTIDPSTQTNSAGQASVTLYGGGQTPNDGGILGNAHVSMFTYGRDSILIKKSASLLFSGKAVITATNATHDSLIVYDGGYFDLSYKIADVNGNPLASGNNVSMSVSGTVASSINLSGDVSVATPDTRDTNSTFYHLRVTDNTPNGGLYGDFKVTIVVSGVNGSATKILYGTLGAPQTITSNNPAVHRAAQISYVGASATDLYISGVGALQNAVVTYQVLDSLGLAIAASPKYGATYNISFQPNNSVVGTSPQIIPTMDSTDSQGKLRVSIISGTGAGVVELVATIDLGGGKIITSQPVKISIHAGFPAQNHFTFYQGIKSAGGGHFVIPYWGQVCKYPFSVVVGDTFSNPVAQGTAVYFHSQAGVMETGESDFLAYTDEDGMATVNLITSNPLPFNSPYYDPIYRKGCTWLYAQTQSKNGLYIIDSLLIIWNEGPIIVTGMPNSITMNAHGVSAAYPITVKDVNGNPLTDGTSISISFTAPPNTSGFEFDVAGDLPATLPNADYARFPGAGITDFTFSVVDASTISMSGTSVIMTFTVTAPVSSCGSGGITYTYKVPITVN